MMMSRPRCSPVKSRLWYDFFLSPIIPGYHWLVRSCGFWAVAWATLLTTITISACSNQYMHDDTASGISDVQTVSPLIEFIGPDFTQRSLEENQQHAEKLEGQRQELISQCMREAGFDYIPHPAPFGITGIRSGVDYQPNDYYWVTQWGYGIVDSPFGSTAQIIDMDGWNANNPNEELLAELSATERTAWRNALNGIAPIDSIDGAAVFPEEMTRAELGCSRWAANEVPFTAPGQDLLLTDEFAPLLEALSQMNIELQNNPSVLAVEEDWSNCMADAGFPGFSAQWMAKSRIESELSALPVDQRSGTERAVALQEREISMALVDLACRESTNFTDRQNAARLAAEEQFVADHRTELEAFRSAAEQRD